MKAFLKNYRQSPRKTRLIADLVRGKTVAKALATLQFTEKRAAEQFTKLVNSAVANAKAQGIDDARLIIKKVTVDKGLVMKRFMPVARGSSHPINRRSSHIAIELEVK